MKPDLRTMPMRYRIERYGYAGHLHDTRTLERSDAARHHLRRAVYDMLAADGLLDSHRAWLMMGDVATVEIAPVDPGSWRVFTLRLRVGDLTGPHVVLIMARLDECETCAASIETRLLPCDECGQSDAA